MPASTANQSTDTRDKILDAAEGLFVERGFSATSLRAIADRAGVNLAATNYHFGSKKGLLAEAFHRHLGPINEQRMANLKQLKSSKPAPNARAILEAFFNPFVQGDVFATAPAVIGWIYSEPEAVTRSVMEQEFREVSSSFQKALADVLPKIDPVELQWRFHFMIGSMIHLLKLNTPLGITPTRNSFKDGLERLINYSIAGLEQYAAGKQDD